MAFDHSGLIADCLTKVLLNLTRLKRVRTRAVNEADGVLKIPHSKIVPPIFLPDITHKECMMAILLCNKFVYDIVYDKDSSSFVITEPAAS